MDTGQIIAVMQQMPATASAPQTGEGVVPMEQSGGVFAGLLQGISQQKPVQVVTAKQVVPQDVAGVLTVPDMMNEGVATLLTALGGNEKQVLPAQADSTGEKPPKPTLRDEKDREPQNVSQDVNGSQLMQLLTQLNAILPGTTVTAGSRTEGPGSTTQVDRLTAVLDGTGTAQIGIRASVQNATTSGPDHDSAIPIGTLSQSAITPGEETAAELIAGSKCAATAQNEKAVTEGDMQALRKPVQEGPADAVKLVPAVHGARQSEVSLVQVWESSPVVAEMKQEQQPTIMVSREVVGESAGSKMSPKPEAVAGGVAEAEKNVVQSVKPEIQGRVVTMSSAPSVTENLEAPAQVPGTPVHVEQLQKVRSATSFAPVATVVDSKTEAPVRLDLRETVKISQGAQVATGENITAVSSGEQLDSSGEHEMPDRGMNGNIQSNALHQQVKAESSPAVSTVSGAALNDASRALPSEQVVQQVKERLVNHETKPGSEQIVLRLSPEHLGELKVNLNLEGQRLKVEIVAENRVVRDSLMQHTDALKESLSRQNIKMESFEVTTGGNTTTDSGRSQGDWRELAQQRQQKNWLPAGGYRVASQIEPAIAAYQMKSEHMMVDLHF